MTDTIQYITDTAVIDIISNADESVEIKASGEFADFNHISDSLDIKDILGYAERSTQHKHIDKTTLCDKSISHCKVDNVIHPTNTNHFWEKEITAAGSIRHDQVSGRVQGEAHKQTPCLFPSALMSCKSSGSTPAVDFGIDNKSTAPTIALNDSHIYRFNEVDLTTGNNMAQTLTTGNELVKSVKKSLKTLPCASSRVGDKTVNTQNNALRLIGFVEKAQATLELDTTMAEATHLILPVTQPHIDASVEDYILSENHSNSAYVPRDFISLVQENDLLPDLVFVGKPTYNPSVPWGRITVALAGFIGSIIRR